VEPDDGWELLLLQYVLCRSLRIEAGTMGRPPATGAAQAVHLA
jgi:hypothetical protein